MYFVPQYITFFSICCSFLHFVSLHITLSSISAICPTTLTLFSIILQESTDPTKIWPSGWSKRLVTDSKVVGAGV